MKLHCDLKIAQKVAWLLMHKIGIDLRGQSDGCLRGVGWKIGKNRRFKPEIRMIIGVEKISHNQNRA